jgi:hypothetical protein
VLRLLRRAVRSGHAARREQAHAAEALQAAGDWAGARARYARILAREPDHPSALRRLADLAQLEGRAGEAEALWRRFAAVRSARPEPWLQLARLRLRAGDRGEALALAERAVALAPPGNSHEIAHRARSLRDHLARPAAPLGARHVAIGGMSFCGSTLLGFLLGSLPGVVNVGESHALVWRRVGMRPVPPDFASDAPEGMVPCTYCGFDCPVWTVPFRRALLADPLDWYGRLAERVGTRVLVSSDKNHAKLSGLDPLGRHDLVVLFKSPDAAWASAKRRPRPPRTPALYLARWEREYRKLLHDLPVEGRRIVLHFDAFRQDPERHLRRLLERLELSAPEGHDLLVLRTDQHVIGGNGGTREQVRGASGRLAIRPRDAHALPEAERAEVAAYAERSAVFEELRARHAEEFAGVAGARRPHAGGAP